MRDTGLCAICVFCLTCCAGPPPAADLVFRNGAGPREVAIRGESIVAVGDPGEVEPYVGDSTRVVDLEGRLLLPGFHDDRVSLLAGARLLDGIWLGDAETHDEILEIVRVFAETHPGIDIIHGYGWRYHVVEEVRREELETVVPDRPVVLVSQDGRASWTNRKGSALDKIPKHGPSSDLGEVVAYLHRFGITSIRVEEASVDTESLEVRVVDGQQPSDVVSLPPWSASPDWMPSEGRTFPVKSRLDSGARIVFGSGWPYGTLDPLSGIYAVVTREDLDGHPEGGWDPQERIPVETAVRTYTRGAIRVGALADLVVLSEDLLKIPETRIAEVKVEMTVFGGRVVYSAATFPY